jgi:hypothetical protein
MEISQKEEKEVKVNNLIKSLDKKLSLLKKELF